MSGRLKPVEGEASPLVVAAPFDALGPDITANATCCAHFCNPPHQPHVARPLPDQGFEVGQPAPVLPCLLLCGLCCPAL